jgi:branched-chain amino acid aminotransferase
MARVLTRISVDGDIQPPERAAVRVLDHGFLFGDSVYEVLWWHRGAFVQEREHLERLEASAALVYMDLQANRADLSAAMRATVVAARAGPEDDAYVRLVVTRGVGPLTIDPTVAPRRSVIVVVAPASRPDREAFERGLSLALVARRRTPLNALDPRAKTGNYLNNVLALHEARSAGADDALLRNQAGDLAEASTSNVYLVRRGALATPPVSAGILEGTTRRRVLALCASAGIACAETRLQPSDLAAADEVLLSSSVRGILPVTRIDDKPVGDGRPGPVTRRLHQLFEQAADEEARVAPGVASA